MNRSLAARMNVTENRDTNVVRDPIFLKQVPILHIYCIPDRGGGEAFAFAWKDRDTTRGSRRIF